MAFIAQFLVNPRQVDLDSLQPHDIKEQIVYSEDNVLNSEAESFARIYYSSDGYDLGTAPRFQSADPITYEKDCIRRIVWALYKLIDRSDGASVPSLDDRARLVHHVWAHNYLTWRCQGVRGRDYLLVPFEALPPFERKKRYFVAELALLNSMFVPTYPLADNYCATLAMDVATYRVAFELVQSIFPSCDDPNAMIEYTDRDYNSPSTLH